MTQQDLDELLERARHVRLTPADREKQRRSFAYGNANIENPDVTRQVVDKAAEKLARTVDRRRRR
jgi:hypothetical protein